MTGNNFNETVDGVMQQQTPLRKQHTRTFQQHESPHWSSLGLAAQFQISHSKPHMTIHAAPLKHYDQFHEEDPRLVQQQQQQQYSLCQPHQVYHFSSDFNSLNQFQRQSTSRKRRLSNYEAEEHAPRNRKRMRESETFDPQPGLTLSESKRYHELDSLYVGSLVQVIKEKGYRMPEKPQRGYLTKDDYIRAVIKGESLVALVMTEEGPEFF